MLCSYIYMCSGSIIFIARVSNHYFSFKSLIKSNSTYLHQHIHKLIHVSIPYILTRFTILHVVVYNGYNTCDLCVVEAMDTLRYTDCLNERSVRMFTHRHRRLSLLSSEIKSIIQIQNIYDLASA